MNESTWHDVDQFFNERLVGKDVVLDGALTASDEAGLPQIHVAPNQGKLLMLLARMRGATSILEIGTLAGYSTIWLARGLAPGGRLVTLEVNEAHAAVARRNLVRAGFADAVEVRVGAALSTLDSLASEGQRFDFIFIDADKINYPGYWEWSVKLARPGAVIVADNVVRRGGVLDPESTDANIVGVRALTDLLRNDARVTATAVQTVGSKGYDGFILAIVD